MFSIGVGSPGTCEKISFDSGIFGSLMSKREVAVLIFMKPCNKKRKNESLMVPAFIHRQKIVHLRRSCKALNYADESIVTVPQKFLTISFKRQLTFHGILAFQHLQASDKCCRIVLALFCLIPSGIMSTMSCITEARNSRSKCDSTRCFVTVFATPGKSLFQVVRG